MTAPKDRDELVDVMWEGIDNRNDVDVSLHDFAEAALEALEAAGCTVVPNEATEEMQIAGGLGVRVRAIAKDKLNAAIARSPYRREG